VVRVKIIFDDDIGKTIVALTSMHPTGVAVAVPGTKFLMTESVW
jgi:hypothetical protein